MRSDERRYRRLLLAYPRQHRADLLTTLLDAAADRRPTAPLMLVLDGLRCRLRVRGAGVLLAAACALVCASAVAAFAGWCARQATVAPWPTVEQATALATPVLPAGQPDSTSRRDDPFGPWLSDADSIPITVLGSPELRPGGVYLTYTRPRVPDRTAAYTSAADRLRSAGWHTTVEPDRLVAQRDGLRLTLLYANRDADTEDTVVSVYPAPPPATYSLAAAGAALGALIGWLVAAAGLARAGRQPGVRRAGLLALAGLGAVALMPASVLNLIALIVADSDAGAAPPWAGYNFVLARPSAVLGALLLATAGALSRGTAGALTRGTAGALSRGTDRPLT